MIRKEQMWDAFMTMVDLGKISIIFEDSLLTIDGGEIITDPGDVYDVVAAFVEENR